MVHIIEKSIDKTTSELLPCDLYMNNWPDLQLPGQKGVQVPSVVPVRDPRFFEKNNVAETVQFRKRYANRGRTDVSCAIHDQSIAEIVDVV